MKSEQNGIKQGRVTVRLEEVGKVGRSCQRLRQQRTFQWMSQMGDTEGIEVKQKRQNTKELQAMTKAKGEQ